MHVSSGRDSNKQRSSSARIIAPRISDFPRREKVVRDYRRGELKAAIMRKHYRSNQRSESNKTRQEESAEASGGWGGLGPERQAESDRREKSSDHDEDDDSGEEAI